MDYHNITLHHTTTRLVSVIAQRLSLIVIKTVVAYCVVSAVSVLSAVASPLRMFGQDEMSSTLITDICQDKDGYLWIGTEYGLNKFDGVRFTHYYYDDIMPGQLQDDIIRRLLVDREGCLWVVTNSGVQRYHKESNTFETVMFGPQSTADINDIMETPEGEIWLLSASQGAMRVKGLEAIAIDMVKKPLSGQQADNMYLDSKRRLWIAFSDKGLMSIDMKTGKSRYFDEKVLGEKRILGICETAQKVLTALTYNGVLQYDENSSSMNVIMPVPYDYSAHRLYKDNHGNLLIGSSGRGLFLIDLREKALKPAYVQPGDNIDIGHQKVHAFYCDSSNNVWIGLYHCGLASILGRPYPFHHLPLTQMPFDNGRILRCIFGDRNGNVYVGQEGNGLKKVTPYGECLQTMLDGVTVITAYQDRNGSLWAGTYRQGACRLTENGEPQWLPNTGKKRVESITEDMQGNIYMAVFNDGLHAYDPQTMTERTLGKGNLQLHNPYLNTLLTDSKGRIWIGHYYGIDVYNPKTDRIENIEVDSVLRSAITYAICQTRDGHIWVGTNRGLFLCHGEDMKWSRYTIHDGLPNNIICGIVEAKDGSLWMSTYHGICRMEWKAAGVPKFVSYYRGSGLEIKSYERGVYGYTSHDEVLFGGDKGFVYFNPQKIRKEQFEKGATLTGLIVNNRRISAYSGEDDETENADDAIYITADDADGLTRVSLKYEDNTFVLLFSTMDFRDVRNVCYEYRFTDEPDNVWHQTQMGVSEISFSHVPSGTHTLLVRACDNGIYSPIKKVEIRILPPWYRSTGAYIFYIMVLTALAMLVWRYYKHKRTAQMNEAKIRFFVDISHELRSPLTLIKSPLEKLLRKSNDAETTRSLRNIERNTNRLLTLVNQILSIRKIEKGQMKLKYSETPLADFVEDICHDFDYQVENRHLTLNFTNISDGIKVWIDRDFFDKVVTNLLNNAIKYVDDGGEVTVEVSQTRDGQACLTVSDDGPGIDEAYLQRIFERFYQASARPSAGQMSYGIGLNLTQKIVSLHGGTISARNREEHKGSIFTVRLPLGNGHLPKSQLTDEAVLAAGEQRSNTTSDGVAGITSPEKGNKYVLDMSETAQARRRARKKTGYRIAVVDDDEEIRTFFQTELGESFRVNVYANGQEALAGITDGDVDLVISDVMMPVMDGYELLKRLKSNTQTSHIPVILLTTKTGHEALIKGLEYGADAYMDKPFSLEELEVMVKNLIDNRNRMRGKFSGVQEQEDTVRQVELQGNDAALMDRIMRVVNERLDDSDFNVEALAEDVGLSRVQLHRRMKELTGITVGEFIRNLRLQQAARLLAAGDTTVSQVTYAVGFSNPTHFSSAFKKHFGVTPSEYMEKHKDVHDETN